MKIKKIPKNFIICDGMIQESVLDYTIPIALFIGVWGIWILCLIRNWKYFKNKKVQYE